MAQQPSTFRLMRPRRGYRVLDMGFEVAHRCGADRCVIARQPCAAFSDGDGADVDTVILVRNWGVVEPRKASDALMSTRGW